MELEAIRCESCNYEVLDSSRAFPNLRSLYTCPELNSELYFFMEMQIMQ